MDLRELLRVLRSRWILVAFLAMITVAATAFVFQRVPVEYETQAALVVLAPVRPVVAGAKSADTAAQPVNPFLSFGGSQETAAQVLQVRMSDDALGQRLANAGVRGEWTFAIKGGSGPLLSISAKEDTADHAKASAQAILDAAGDQFASMQREVGSPEDQLVRVAVVNTPSAPEPVYDAKVRMATLIAALGFLLAIGIPVAVEGMARSRQGRAADVAVVDLTDPAEEADEFTGLDDIPAWPDDPAQPVGSEVRSAS